MQGSWAPVRAMWVHTGPLGLRGKPGAHPRLVGGTGFKLVITLWIFWKRNVCPCELRPTSGQQQG